MRRLNIGEAAKPEDSPPSPSPNQNSNSNSNPVTTVADSTSNTISTSNAQDFCAQEFEINVSPCETIRTFSFQMPVQNQVRVFQVSLELQKVCWNKRIALAVLLCNDIDQVMGMKGSVVEAVDENPNTPCTDLAVHGITFVVPVNSDKLCDPREETYKFKVIAHYLDHYTFLCEPDSLTVKNI